MWDDEDGGEGAAKSLLARPVDTSRLAIARSLADATPGEMVVVNRRGQTITPRQFTAMKAASWGTIVVVGAFIGVLYGCATGLLSAPRWPRSPPAGGKRPTQPFSS